VIVSLTENPKPSYSIDGQNVSWSDYLSRLQSTISWCDEQLAADDPFELQSQGFTP